MNSDPAPGDGLLDVGDGHHIHVEETGSGTPIIFLHGGPGSSAAATPRSIFDPNRQRAILFDQRGTGRSVPARRLSANTTQHLIADIETIRQDRGIDRWLVVGGSWGATLALAYAQRHPQHVAGLALRAVFLGTRRELDWAFLDGPASLRPDLLADFLDFLPAEERSDPLPAYWRRILDPDPAIHVPAIWAWHDTERILSQVNPPSQRLGSDGGRTGSLPATPFFEAHYFSHDCFLAENELLANANRLAGIPGIIIQGRYDLLCPPSTSASLAAGWHDAEIRIVENAGHAISDPGVARAVAKSIADLIEKGRF